MTANRHIETNSLEEIEKLTGLEMLQAIVAGTLPAPPIGATMGFRLIEVAPGRAVFEGAAGPHLLNPLGGVHGGVALTLIDSAAGCAVHTELPAGVGYTTVETKVNFTRPVPPDGTPVRCEGRVVTRGRQIATAEARLLSADGKVLAHGTSTLIILPPRG
ncbi:MAG TPA: PaaI family thioesterase [Allosphingosinicella sp.]|nr:PaaI family thioesterase [Allosphingosinicella sp.]